MSSEDIVSTFSVFVVRHLLQQGVYPQGPFSHLFLAYSCRLALGQEYRSLCVRPELSDVDKSYQRFGFTGGFLQTLGPPVIVDAFSIISHVAVPPIFDVPSDPRDRAAEDGRKFPSDEELSQRMLWRCFVGVLVHTWPCLALPLYMISLPCLAETALAPRYLGGYPTLQDRHRWACPPHLRVQRAPPFVCPLTGVNYDEPGAVYSETRTWPGRTRLKTVNKDIRIAQEEGRQAIDNPPL